MSSWRRSRHWFHSHWHSARRGESVHPGGSAGLRGLAPPLPHGITTMDLDTMARRAARFSHWSKPAYAERVDLARSAIVEHAYTCRAPEAGCDLLAVGLRAFEMRVEADQRFYGCQRPRRSPGRWSEDPRPGGRGFSGW